MSQYTCPLCGESIPRDLLLFLSHTDQHIFEVIKRKHPEWVSDDGICKPCLDYYKGSALGS